MQKPARIPLTVSIPKSLEHDLRHAATRQGRSFKSLIEACLRDGYEHLLWDGYADDLLERVNKAQATPGLTVQQRRAIRMKGLSELAWTVAAVTSQQQ